MSVQSADLLYLFVGYLALAMSSRLAWIALRGWHVIGDRDAPLLDVVAVAIPFGMVVAVEPLINAGLIAPTAGLKGLVVATTVAALAGTLLVLVSTGAGLRWQALGHDAAGLERMGIPTRPTVLLVCLLGTILILLSAVIAGPLMIADRYGHLAVAGLVIVVLNMRPTTLLLWVAVTVLISAIWSMQASDPYALIIGALVAIVFAITARRSSPSWSNSFNS